MTYLTYDRVTHLIDEGKALDVVYLDSSKVFDIICHSILPEKLALHNLNGCSVVNWVTKWLDGQVQRLVENAATTSQQSVTSAYSRGQYWNQFV